jgi:hypothetical protein
VRRALNRAAEPVGLGGDADRVTQRGDRVRIFRTDVDVALGGADGDARDRHALDEAIGIAFHKHAVGEGAAVALVGIAADVLLVGLGVVDGLPLDAGGEAGAAAATQARGGDLAHDVDWRHGQRLGEPLEAAMRAIVLNRQRIGDAAACERQALLVLEVGDFVGEPVAELVLLAFEEIGLEEARHILRLHGAISDAALRRLDLDHGLEPQHPARAVAYDLDLGIALFGFGGDRLGDGIGAHRQGGGIAGNVDLDHAAAPRSRSAMMVSKRSLSTHP